MTRFPDAAPANAGPTAAATASGAGIKSIDGMGAVALLYCGAVVVHFALYLFVPYWSGDEYIYKSLGAAIWQFGSPAGLRPDAIGDSVTFPNLLYPYLIAPAFSLHENFYIGTRLLNAAAMSSVVFPAFLVARQFQLHKQGALLASSFAVSISFLWLGAYAVTEVLFYPLFMWNVFAAARALAEWTSTKWNVAVGLLAAALMNVRPNGFVVLIAYLAALLIVSVRTASWRTLLQRPMWLAAPLVLVVSYPLIQGLLGVANVGSLGLYQGVLERKGVLSLLREDPWGVARLAAAHLGTMAIPYALPIGIVAVAASSRSANAAPDNVKRLQVLVAMLLIVAFMMTVGFTVKVAPTDLGGLERLHARYYFYVLPLLLIASVAMRDAWPVDRRLLAAGFAALVLALNFWVLRVSRVPASPWFGSIVDHMDVQWYRHMNWLYWPILAGYLILIWRYAKGVLTRRAVVTGLGCYLLIANAGTAEQARFGRPIDSQECGHLAAFFLRMSPGSYAVVADSRSAKVAVVFWIPSLPARASVVRPGDAPVDVAAALKDVDYVIVNGLPPIVHDGGTPRWSAGTCRLFAAR